MGLLGVRGQVQVSEQGVSRLEFLALHSTGLLYLDDHIRPGKYLIKIAGNIGASISVPLIITPTAQASLMFNPDLMPGAGQGGYGFRGKSDPVFLSLGFFGAANFGHG
ncbi:MAG: hypothetical protein PsegKO_36290 [Pseudohongiellaceae bacterium]